MRNWRPIVTLLVGLVCSPNLQAQFDYAINLDLTITITGYSGLDKVITIPPAMNGLPVTSIAPAALANHNLVTNLWIPSSITNIGPEAFTECERLQAIVVDPNNPVYCSLDGVLFDKKKTRLIQYPGGLAGNYLVPDTVNRIMDYAFHGSVSLTNVSICDSVGEIGTNAFSQCGQLTSVTIGEGVTNIGEYAFAYCDRLRGVTLGKSVVNIERWAFGYCESLINMVIPSNMTSIGYSVFGYCYGLTNIDVPITVTNIAASAFCPSGLRIIKLPGVTSIGWGAFWWCTNLTTIVLGPKLTMVGGQAFGDCYTLQDVYFTGNLPVFGDQQSFYQDDRSIIYYLPNTKGWTNVAQGRPALAYNPAVVTDDANFGCQRNQFGFDISGNYGLRVEVAASTSLVAPNWVSLKTITLTNIPAYFGDLEWSHYSERFYCLRFPWASDFK